MNLRFVEAFYWAVMLGSITRASEKLFITQSALSSRIAALEDELGMLLLDRRDKQFRLTIAGTRFHRHAERLLSLQREIRQELGSAATRDSVLRVGVIESVLHSWLIDWVQALRDEQPALQLELTVETTPVLMDHMRRGAADLVLTALPVEGPGLHTRALEPMAMVFVARKGTRRAASAADAAAGRPRERTVAQRAQASERTLAQLAQDSELLTFQRGSQPQVALLEQCRRQGVAAPRVHSISSISAMVELVEQGFGVATLPLAAAERLARRRPLELVPLNPALAPLPIHLSWRDDPSTPLVGLAAERATAFGKPRANPRSSSKKSMKT